MMLYNINNLIFDAFNSYVTTLFIIDMKYCISYNMINSTHTKISYSRSN